MLKHYIRITIRQFSRHRISTAISLIGLAVAIACGLLVLAFVRHEKSFDRFHEHADRIVRVYEKQVYPTGDLWVAVTPYPLAPALQRDFSEIEAAVRVYYGRQLIVSRGTDRFLQYPLFADSQFFRLFSYRFRAGDPATALALKNSVVISSEVAGKLFPDENPIGKPIQVNGMPDLTVTGVLDPLPANTHLRFDLLVSLPTVSDTWPPEQKEAWGTNAFVTYLLLAPAVNRADFDARLEGSLKKYRDGQGTTTLYPQPLTDIHLGPSFVADNAQRSDPQRISLFIFAAVLVLLIAGLNFVNLATAQANLRFRELGVRSCLGAALGDLRRQILCETAIITGLASLLALAIGELAYPLGQSLFGTSFPRQDLLSLPSFAALVAGWILISLAIGTYLGLITTRRTTIRWLKVQPSGRSLVRTVLVICQFVVSIGMILVALVMVRQQNLAMATRLGASGEQILIVPLRSDDTREKTETLRQALRAVTGVKAVTALDQIPNDIENSSTFDWEGQPPDQTFLLNVCGADEHFFATFGVRLTEGRAYTTTEQDVCILNEAAVRKIGWDDPIGKVIGSGPDARATVVGVVEDFHFTSLRNEIAPLVMFPRESPSAYGLLAVSLDPNDIGAAGREIEKRFTQICPATPYSSSFFDETFARLYAEEIRAQKLVGAFAALAILLACLGLYGLAIFSLQRRTKEMGIRRVFGASMRNIISLHTREHVIWLIAANAVGLTLGLLVSRHWLERFAYRTSIPWWLLAAVAAASVLLVALTVGIQTIRAARTKPVESLRYE